MDHGFWPSKQTTTPQKICVNFTQNTFVRVNLIKSVSKFTHWLGKHYTKIS